MAELLSNPGPPETPSAESREHASETASESSKANSSHQGSKGHFVKIDGSVGGSGYDETTVEYVFAMLSAQFLLSFSHLLSRIL